MISAYNVLQPSPVFGQRQYPVRLHVCGRLGHRLRHPVLPKDLLQERVTFGHDIQGRHVNIEVQTTLHCVGKIGCLLCVRAIEHRSRKPAFCKLSALVLNRQSLWVLRTTLPCICPLTIDSVSTATLSMSSDATVFWMSHFLILSRACGDSRRLRGAILAIRHPSC